MIDKKPGLTGLGNLVKSQTAQIIFSNKVMGGDTFNERRYWYYRFGAHSVVGNSALFNDPAMYLHELHHLWQSRAFGDTFLLNYGLHGVGAILMGGSFIKSYNYFEDQAYGGFWW